MGALLSAMGVLRRGAFVLSLSRFQIQILSSQKLNSFSSRMIGYLAAAIFILHSIVVATEEVVVAPDELTGRFAGNLAPPGFNINGTSVLTNFLNAYNNKQLFFRTSDSRGLFENPSSAATMNVKSFYWCADLSFSNIFDNSQPMGLVGRCVQKFYSGKEQIVEQGAQLTDDTIFFDATLGISSVYVDQINAFDFVAHRNNDHVVIRIVDDGRPKSQFILWEAHDAGDDITPNAVSVFAKVTWLTTEEASLELNVNATELSPERFTVVYAQVWTGEYKAAETSNQESNTTKEPTTNSSIDAAGSDASSESDSIPSGSGRKLSSMTMRLASAVLRVLGI